MRQVSRIGIGFVVLVVASWVTAETPAPAKAPKLEVVSDTVDLGEVTRGEVVVASYELRNVGEGPLRILKAKPGWGCAVASYDEEILPGKVGKVEATLDTHKLRGPSTRLITLETNDPLLPMTVLTIQADIVGSVIMIPAPRIMVGSARGTRQNDRVLVAKDPRENGELVVSDVRTEMEWLSATARRVEVEEPGDGRFPKAAPGNWIVRVDVGDDAPKGTTRTELTFKTGLGREPEVTIPVVVSVIPPVVVNPERLRLNPEGAGDRLSGSLLAIVRADLRGEQLVVDASSQAVEVSLEPAGARRYRVHASIPSGSLQPDDHLILRVGDGTSVEVPLFPPLGAPAGAP